MLPRLLTLLGMTSFLSYFFPRVCLLWLFRCFILGVSLHISELGGVGLSLVPLLSPMEFVKVVFLISSLYTWISCLRWWLAGSLCFSPASYAFHLWVVCKWLWPVFWFSLFDNGSACDFCGLPLRLSSSVPRQLVGVATTCIGAQAKNVASLFSPIVISAIWFCAYVWEAISTTITGHPGVYVCIDPFQIELASYSAAVHTTCSSSLWR